MISILLTFATGLIFGTVRLLNKILVSSAIQIREKNKIMLAARRDGSSLVEGAIKFTLTSEDNYNEVFISILCAAPWNRISEHGFPPPLKGIETILIASSIKYFLAFFKNQPDTLVVELLADHRAWEFYNKIGMATPDNRHFNFSLDSSLNFLQTIQSKYGNVEIHS